MNILVLGGMHGPPEKTGLELVRSLEASPIDGVRGIIANEQAVCKGLRFVKQNMAFAFPGDIGAEDYEWRRPAELIRIASDYDIVLDIHDRPDVTEEYSVTSHKDQLASLGIAAGLGIGRVLTMPLEHSEKTIGVHIKHSLTLEMTRGDVDVNVGENVKRLRTCIGNLAVSQQLSEFDPSNFEFYRYIREISTDEANKLGLKEHGYVPPFGSISPQVLKLLELNQSMPSYAEYWNGTSSAGDKWFGGVLERVTYDVFERDSLLH